MQRYILLVLIILFILCSMRMIGIMGTTEGMISTWGYINDDISIGNIISQSKRKNLPGKHRKQKAKLDSRTFTFYGHGVPLPGETKLGKHDKVGKEIWDFNRNNYKCSTKCCPSQYSCDGGCVCYFKEE